METMTTKKKIFADKIVKLNGGLGNQMFQYAFAYSLAKQLNINVSLDLSWFEAVKTHKNVTPRLFELDVFNIEYEAASKEDLERVIYSNNNTKFQKLLWKVFKVKKYKPLKNTLLQRKAHNFDGKLLTSKDYFYYDGYFQNEEYFKNIRNDILNCFSLKDSIDEKNQSVLNEIIKTNSVSIHIRRGDYVALKCANKFHGICSIQYYEKAIKYIAKHVENPHFFLFSDDIEWVVKNLKIDYPHTFVDFNQNKGWLDMNLMKHCKHNIVANSSFSWWGAWLNENNSKIIISPKKWTKKKIKGNIVPGNWIKI